MSKKGINQELEEMIIDPEGLVEEINVEEIEDDAKRISFAMCKNLREIYFDEEFMSRNHKLKERLDVELESLRVLIKMRKSNEIVHDLCLRSIGMNTNNASLYKSLVGIQGSLLNIQRQMDETVRNINSLLKNTQLELNFDRDEAQGNEQENVNQENNTGITRGSKRFIEQMKQQLYSEQSSPTQEQQTVLFEDEIEENEREEQ